MITRHTIRSLRAGLNSLNDLRDQHAAMEPDDRRRSRAVLERAELAQHLAFEQYAEELMHLSESALRAQELALSPKPPGHTETFAEGIRAALSLCGALQDVTTASLEHEGGSCKHGVEAAHACGGLSVLTVVIRELRSVATTPAALTEVVEQLREAHATVN